MDGKADRVNEEHRYTYLQVFSGPGRSGHELRVCFINNGLQWCEILFNGTWMLKEMDVKTVPENNK